MGGSVVLQRPTGSGREITYEKFGGKGQRLKNPCKRAWPNRTESCRKEKRKETEKVDEREK